MTASPARRRMAQKLLAWYDRHRRRLPWRADPGIAADPYAVWLSEIMLQQTTVAAVKPYFERFLARWPTVADLAAAPLDDVLAAWAGLGYYARARNLHACARAVASDHGGVFPDTEAGLRALPGIGPYTAAAIAAIAFGRRAVVVDGNVERVMARLHDVDEPLPGAKRRLHALADALTPDRRAGDYAQAVMDLGATICTPKSPACALCPWAPACAARAAGTALDRPRRSPKAKAPTRRGLVFWIARPDGAVLVRRRPPTGLLGGMMEFPSTPWRAAAWTVDQARAHAPIKRIRWRPLPGTVAHTFTHFHLALEVIAADVTAAAARAVAGPDLVWATRADFDRLALPNVMRKVAAHVDAQVDAQVDARVDAHVDAARVSR
ncbi:MAG: A/G-specific adenine glycosylase [Rhodospirillaceae bacterium]|nr:A/G-specific adenine glycosylase [Rhodospirillaceae bacterium]